MIPTHKKGNILDILLTNNAEMLHSYECNETIFSDHYFIGAKINYKNVDQKNGEEEIKIKTEKSSTNFDRLNLFQRRLSRKKIKKTLRSSIGELNSGDAHPRKC